MKLNKFIFVALVSFSFAIQAQAWVPGTPSLPTDFDDFKKATESFFKTQINHATETLQKKSEELHQYSKSKCSEIFNQASQEWERRLYDLTGINSDPQQAPTKIEIAPTPQEKNCDGLCEQVTSFNTAQKAAKIQINAEALTSLSKTINKPLDYTPITLPSIKEIKMPSFTTEMPDFNKVIKDALENNNQKTNLSPSSTTHTSFTTRLLDALGDPWIRIAVITGVIVYARYKYKQSQEQLKEFEEDKKTSTK